MSRQVGTIFKDPQNGYEYKNSIPYPWTLALLHKLFPVVGEADLEDRVVTKQDGNGTIFFTAEEADMKTMLLAALMNDALRVSGEHGLQLGDCSFRFTVIAERP